MSVITDQDVFFQASPRNTDHTSPALSPVCTSNLDHPILSNTPDHCSEFIDSDCNSIPDNSNSPIPRDSNCDADISPSVSESDVDNNSSVQSIFYDSDLDSEQFTVSHTHPESDHDTEDSDCDDIIIDESLYKPLYEGANITVCGAYCAIMKFKNDCKLSFTTIDKLLKLLELLITVGSSLPKSVFILKSFFQRNSGKPLHQKFCPECLHKMANNEDKCTNCSGNGKYPNYLYTFKPRRRISNIVSRKYYIGCSKQI